MADVRGDRVLRYHLDGMQANEVSFSAVGGVTSPRVGTCGSAVWVVSSWTNVLSLEGAQLRPQLVAGFSAVTFPDGASVLDIRSPQPWQGDIVGYAQLKLANRQRFSGLVRFILGPTPGWDPVFPAPLMTAAGSMAWTYCEVIAAVGEHLYALLYDEPSRIVELMPTHRTLRAFPTGFEKLPPHPADLAGEAAAQQSWASMRAAAIPVGLYGQGRFLYLVTREPAPAAATTWRLHRIDTVADTLVGSLTLPTTAADLLVLPGEPYWALIEKGPYKAGFVHDTLGMVLIPATAIQGSWPPGSHDVPPCASPAAER